MKGAKPKSRNFWRRHRLHFALLGLVVLGMAVAAALYVGTGKTGFAPGEPVEVAIVYPAEQESDDFLAAIRIAVDQVNAQGGILGHPLALQPFEEDSYTGNANLEKVVSKTLKLATRIGKSPSILAVVGHGSSATAVPASAVYNRYNKLFMATHATATSLSNPYFNKTFALQPNNADNASMLASYALSHGLRRLIVLSDNSNYGIETTDQFRSLFAQDGGTILLHTRLVSSNQSIEDLLLFILDNQLFRPKDIDAIFITSSNIKETADFIVRARQLGLHVPILGSEYLYSDELVDSVGLKAMRDVVAVSVFNQDTTTPEGERLSEPFEKATGHKPGLLAAMGFDAIKVLAYAATKAGTLDAETIADTLRIIRYDAPFIGTSGPIAFDAHDLITDTSAYVVRHDGTQFRTVATYRKPFVRGADDSFAATIPKLAPERKQTP